MKFLLIGGPGDGFEGDTKDLPPTFPWAPEGEGEEAVYDRIYRRVCDGRWVYGYAGEGVKP